MASQPTGSRQWPLVQFGYGAFAFLAAVLALAMTFPTPPWFDVQLISTARPALLVSAPVLGVLAVLLTPWSLRAAGRWRQMAIASIVLASGGVGLGLSVAGVLAGAG